MSIDSIISATDDTWMDRGSCLGLDPDLFFPGRGDDVEAPKAVCRGCPVMSECLEFALDNKIADGVWGATTEKERRVMRRRRREASVTKVSA
jgi:WhiB family transcriptional regulator, redox-sensing transcriptional regulator